MSSSQDRSQNLRSGGDRSTGRRSQSQDDDNNRSPSSDIRPNLSLPRGGIPPSTPGLTTTSTSTNNTLRRNNLQVQDNYNDNNITSQQQQQRSPATPVSRVSMSMRNTPIGSNRNNNNPSSTSRGDIRSVNRRQNISAQRSPSDLSYGGTPATPRNNIISSNTGTPTGYNTTTDIYTSGGQRLLLQQYPSSTGPRQRSGIESQGNNRNQNMNPNNLRLGSSPGNNLLNTSMQDGAIMDYYDDQPPSQPQGGSQQQQQHTPGDTHTRTTHGGGGGGGGSTRTNTAGQMNPLPSSIGSVHKEALLYGTTVGLGPTMQLVKSFLYQFRMSMATRIDREEQRLEYERREIEIPVELAAEYDPVTDEYNEPPHYKALLEELIDIPQAGQYSLIGIDAKHIFSFPEDGRKLYSQLVRYPQEIIPIFDMVLNDEFRELATKSGLDENFVPPAVRARFFNLRDPKRMRMLDPVDIDTLVSVRGMVIRTSEIIPDMRKGHFRCSACGFTVDVEVENGRLEEPSVCSGCTVRHTMTLIHNRCVFFDKQMIKLQETPESIPEGETPMTIVLYAFEDLVDAVVPGDRVQVTGVFRAVGSRINPRQRALRSVFRTYVDVIHFQKADKDRIGSMDPLRSGSEYTHDVTIATDTAMNDHRAERCRAMARQPDLYTRLAHSLAPSIWELDDVKKGVLLQLFGGCNKDLGREGKIRGEINVLLCGDPGTSKSQLLTYVHRIAPRGMYTSGTGSSAVGLTAYITKDPESKEPVLESGALVLSDRGICCIDEFDKMSDATRSILHEVMEQQTVSIAKAGIICTLNARTSVLASANPVESRYNPNLSVVENIQLPPTLLSRFDLIYLILDTVNADADRRLARHLVSLHWPESLRENELGKVGSSGLPLFDRTAVMEYISYVKETIQPVITDSAFTALVSGYLDMRKLGAMGRTGGRKTITATTRQLESLIRLSEAHARMRFSITVDHDDVNEAIRLMNMATQRAAVDPRTGTINMELITTGHSSLERDAQAMLVEEVREALEDRAALGPGRSMTVSEVQKILDRNTPELSISREALTDALRELSNEDNAFLQLDGRGERIKFLQTRESNRHHQQAAYTVDTGDAY